MVSVRLVWIALVGLLMGCSTMNGARPLEADQQAASVTFGGAMVEFGGNFIPMPHLMVEGRRGLGEVKGVKSDVHGGINLTAAAFGQIGLHGGSSHLLMEQSGGVPAIAFVERFYLYTNHADGNTHIDGRGFWALQQSELVGSWALGNHLIYTGLAQYTDLGDPSLLLTPMVGGEFFGPADQPGWGLQLEARWFAMNRDHDLINVTWLQPLGVGALGLSAGVRYTFGGAQ